MNLRVVGVRGLQALRSVYRLEVADVGGGLLDAVTVPREVADAFLRLAGEPALPPEPPPTSGGPAEGRTMIAGEWVALPRSGLATRYVAVGAGEDPPPLPSGFARCVVLNVPGLTVFLDRERTPDPDPPPGADAPTVVGGSP